MPPKRIPLFEQIGTLVSALGGSQPIPAGKLKNALMALVADAKNLEEGHLAAEAESQIPSLKADIKELKSLRKKQEAENANLAAMLKEAEDQINRLLREEQERQESSKRLNDIQKKILVCVRIGGVKKSVADIAAEVGLGDRVDIAETHLHLLRDLNFAWEENTFRNRTWVVVWSRRPEGNDYVLENNLLEVQTAPPEIPPKTARKTDRLGQAQENVFTTIFRSVPLTSTELTEATHKHGEVALSALARDGFAEQRRIDREGRLLDCWFLTEKGMNYIDRHKLE